MAKRKRGQPVHGWVVVDKPIGPTSTQVVGMVRRLFDAEKAGHGGTLDPLASGILPIALGEATKTVSFAMDGTKRYRFTIKWGERTDTDDAEGAVVARSAVRPKVAEVQAVLAQFIGCIEQVPPIYSAIKVDGERAYDLARNAVPLELEPRLVEIDSLDLIDLPDADHAIFEAQCGKGTYMRALARDIAAALGAEGHVVALRRLQVGCFDESRAISLDALRDLGQSPALFEHLLNVEAALDDIPAFALSEDEASRLRFGQPVPLIRRVDRERLFALQDAGIEAGDVFLAACEGRAVALVRLDQAALVPVRVLNL